MWSKFFLRTNGLTDRGIPWGPRGPKKDKLPWKYYLRIFTPVKSVDEKRGMHILYLSLFFPIWMIEFHRKWKFWLRQLEEIDFLVSRTSSAASWWCAGSLEGVISSFQDYSQIDIDSCCTSQDLLHLQFHLLDWWMMIPTFWLRSHQRRIGGAMSVSIFIRKKMRKILLCFFSGRHDMNLVLDSIAFRYYSELLPQAQHVSE